MKAFLVALTAALAIALSGLPGLVVPAQARPAPVSRDCNPQYPACEPARVGLIGPTTAKPRTRVPFTCVVRLIGTTARPVGTVTLRVGRAGRTYSVSGRHRLGDTGRVVIRTPRLPRGKYNVRCRHTPRGSTIFAPGMSGNRRLLVRRGA
ncbi:hypothetical protein [Nocardioides rubriscoriae]|uniref:hypothetical protein n=1 Tax=Nocardioides rubriscoriae TaxID=642762 RepID=UPI0011E014DF|nr:hypothetical protein [Nocardioides rubriscoriae]